MNAALIVPLVIALVTANVGCWWMHGRDQAQQIARLKEDIADLLSSAEEAHAAQATADGYGDALSTIADSAEWGGDIDGIRAHARQALETGDYHGRLRGTQDAVEQIADENVRLRARIAAEQRADLEAASIEDAGREW